MASAHAGTKRRASEQSTTSEAVASSTSVAAVDAVVESRSRSRDATGGVRDAKTRILKELKELMEEAPDEITATPLETSIFHWTGSIMGPKDSPYAGGVFDVEIQFPSDVRRLYSMPVQHRVPHPTLGMQYPYKPPAIKFRTKLYHPNVDSAGGICLDILKDQWSPALTIRTVLISLVALLESPNPKDPLVPAIATEFTHDRATFDSKARKATRDYAMPSSSRLR